MITSFGVMLIRNDVHNLADVDAIRRLFLLFNFITR